MTMFTFLYDAYVSNLKIIMTIDKDRDAPLATHRSSNIILKEQKKGSEIRRDYSYSTNEFKSIVKLMILNHS